MTEKRKFDTLEIAQTCWATKKARLEPHVETHSDPSMQVHFFTTLLDGTISVHTFQRDSTPEGEVIYEELMKLWRLDNVSWNRQDGLLYRLFDNLGHFVDDMLLRKCSISNTCDSSVYSEQLNAVKDWGKWTMEDKVWRNVYKGEMVFFDARD